MCHDLQSSEGKVGRLRWKIMQCTFLQRIIDTDCFYIGCKNVCVCMYVDTYIHVSYFVCGKLTFDYTKWPQYEADHLPPSSAKAMKG